MNSTQTEIEEDKTNTRPLMVNKIIIISFTIVLTLFNLGIWADDSDDDGEESKSSNRRGGGGGGGRNNKDYTAPVSFISGGIQGKKKPENSKEEKHSDEDDDEDSGKKGMGFRGEEYSSESEEEVRAKPQQMAGMRKTAKPSGSSKGEW